MKNSIVTTLDQIGRFDTIIDVRSPSEFAEDHIPGAINCPVLDDAQRAQVGTIYKQVSPFEARKIGAALVAENIARHLREKFADRPRHWRPLIYCWRGGQRSGAMTIIFRQVGWDAMQLEGGYKNYRRHVVATLAELPHRFRYQVVCGPTGSAKSRVLQALAAKGAQVLDLEELAAHKGSVLGVLPDRPQPAQKMFESVLLQTLSGFDPTRPVFVEAESRKIGALQVPEALIESMRASPCVAIEAPLSARVEFLLGDYAYFVADADWLIRRLEALRPLRGAELVDHWIGLAREGAWREFVQEMLERHYDPLYRKSQDRNYTGYQAPASLAAEALAQADIDRLADAMLAQIA